MNTHLSEQDWSFPRTSNVSSLFSRWEMKEELSLKKEHIRFFLHQFADMDYTDIDCQKRLIKIFLNSVFVYDDKVVLTFNYSEDGKILTLHEIDGGSGHSIRIPSGLVHHEKTRSCKAGARFFIMICVGICFQKVKAKEFFFVFKEEQQWVKSLIAHGRDVNKVFKEGRCAESILWITKETKFFLLWSLLF